MTLALRAHHLLCLLTYAGTGYSPGFVENFDRIAARLGAGEEFALIPGPDAVCAPVCAADGDGAHCHASTVRLRDDWAEKELEPLLGQPGPQGVWRLTACIVGRLRLAFAESSIRGACAGCQWAALCTQVAKSGYVGVRLHPPAT